MSVAALASSIGQLRAAVRAFDEKLEAFFAATRLCGTCRFFQSGRCTLRDRAMRRSDKGCNLWEVKQ